MKVSNSESVRRFREVPVLDRKLTVRRQFKHGNKSNSKRMSGKHQGKRVNDLAKDGKG